MSLDEFIHLPWQNIAGFIGFLIALTILFSKWIPGARQMVESTVRWLGVLFTQETNARIDATNSRIDTFTVQTNEKLDQVLGKMDDHVSDPHAHRETP
jgi:hypothetical protein